MSDYATEERFREVFDLVQAYIERRWEVPVMIRDVADPFTGDLDGAHIEVDYDQSFEDALFIIAHLFGHTVQWNTDPRARTIGIMRIENPSEELVAEVREYERTACRYSLQLFHDAGVEDLDQWMADFATCDLSYLISFYLTARKQPFRNFWKRGTTPLEALPIPEFQPTRWVSRADGVVI